MIKRLGIFCTYDSEGIIDDYVIFLLQDIKKVLSHLSIVCNGILTPESRNRLEQITDDIFVRDNSGFDMEAWRQGILRRKEVLKDYDEVLIFNDSFYGPFYSFEKVFEEMDKRNPNADFWGLTVHGQMPDALNICPYGYIPEHIQSYFLVIRSRMFHSPEFLDYWVNSEQAQNYEEAVRLHEVCFTKIFADKGFTYDVYCDTRNLEKEYDVKVDQTVINAERLLREYKCPILKKRVFLAGRRHYIQSNYADEPRRCLDFVKNSTDYDSNLIWQNLLRKQNITFTKENLGLDYILSDEFCFGNVQSLLSKTVIIAHLYYEDLMPECVEYLCKIPKEVNIIVTVNSAPKKLIVENLFKGSIRDAEVRLVSARGRDMSALWVGCAETFKKYKYLCFIHDKKSVRKNESVTIGRSFFKLLWENVIGGENFIKNILATFESEPQLGLLVPPRPYNGEYKFLYFLAKYWSGACFDRTVALGEELGILHHFIRIEYSPLAIGNVFWCRTAALKKVFDKNWKIEDFPEEPMPFDGTVSHALERIYPFAAQAEGFYTGQLFNAEFAREELENFAYFAMEPYLAPITHDSQSQVSNDQSMYQHFLNLTTLQCLKFYLQSRIPHKFWGILRPFKNFLSKLGFKV